MPSKELVANQMQETLKPNYRNEILIVAKLTRYQTHVDSCLVTNDAIYQKAEQSISNKAGQGGNNI